MRVPESWLTADCVRTALGESTRRHSIAVFRNGLLDRFLARAHPAFPAAFYGPILTGVLIVAHRADHGVGEAGAFMAGFFVLTFVEYAVHRFLFHRAIPPSRAGRIHAFLKHGYHHSFPRDATRLVLPPLVTIPLSIATFLVAHMALGLTGDMSFCGFLGGYIAYDSLHYVAHHSRAKRGPLAWLRRYHLLHHHDGEPARYGVSSPVWDLVFGTYRPVKRNARNAHVAR